MSRTEPLLLGAYGEVLAPTRCNGRVQARTKFRDYDGRVRSVSRVARSRAAGG